LKEFNSVAIIKMMAFFKAMFTKNDLSGPAMELLMALLPTFEAILSITVPKSVIRTQAI
jgi:hypothetical protein